MLTAVAIYSIVALGLGLLMGRVGLVSLGQIAVLALGAWVAARLWLRDRPAVPARAARRTGLITMVLGTLVGLPALRLSGLYLALITLMLAGAITVVLHRHELPQRRPGLPRPHRVADSAAPRVRRPAIAESDPGYFRYTVVVAALMFAARAAGTCAASRAAPGRRSARASPPRSPRA